MAEKHFLIHVLYVRKYDLHKMQPKHENDIRYPKAIALIKFMRKRCTQFLDIIEKNFNNQ